MRGNDAKLTREQLELEIIRQLQKGVLQPTDIARNLDPYKANNSTLMVRIYRRMKSMQERGIILGYYAKLSLEKIGYSQSALFHVTLNKPIDITVVSEFERNARNMKQIISLHFLDDPKVDYAGVIAFTAKRDLKHIAAKIQRCKHVQSVVLFPVLRTPHFASSPPALQLAP